MSDISSESAKKPMEQPDNDLSEAMENLSVTNANDSDKTSPPKSFSDMPLDVVGLFIERSDYKEQLILRKVSKSLRSLVDKQKPNCKILEVFCTTSCVICNYNNHHVAYTSTENAHGLKRKLDYPFHTAILRNDFEKVALDDFASTLRNPKLQLEKFSFAPKNHFCFVKLDDDDYDWETDERYLKDVLKSLSYQLPVKSFKFDLSFPSIASSILPYLKPGVLEKITVVCNIRWSEETIKQISLLDQWKQAEQLELYFEIFYGYFLTEYTIHFNRFRIKETMYTGERLVRIRDWLLKQDNFEYCLVEFRKRYIPHSATHEFAALVGKPAPPNARTEYVNHYSIPDSECFLEFLFFEETIEIRKMKRSNRGF